ncbi:MAG: PH domain-containing protein [Dehalococcoidia bacterium]|nr:PH domain-containing protein [Dehalococcoidia bacterium]HRC87120.1 PH domain-containing protein [Thermoanaerobaculia bacterium]
MAFPKRLLIEGEELVLSMHPHWAVLILPSIVTALVLAGWAVLIPNVPDNGAGDTTRWVLLGGGLLVLVAYPLRAWLTWLNSYFVVTSDRVIHRQGIIGKYSMEIPLEAVNDVRFNQSVFERLLGAGDLIIESASEQGRQVFSDIWHPERVQRTIYEQGELNQQRMYQGRGRGDASVDELERLAALHERGALTDAEFEAQKRRLLG